MNDESNAYRNTLKITSNQLVVNFMAQTPLKNKNIILDNVISTFETPTTFFIVRVSIYGGEIKMN